MTKSLANLLHRQWSLIDILLVTYLAAIIYGSLYPLKAWYWPDTAWVDFSQSLWPRYFTRTDIMNNLLVYMPLGTLLTLRFMKGTSYRKSLLMATLVCLTTSLMLEICQIALPQRIASLLDTSLNATGGLIGGLVAAFISKQTEIGHKAHTLGYEIFLPGRRTELGLIIIATWVLSLLVPFDLSLNMNTLQNNLAPVLHIVNRPDDIVFQELVFYISSTCVLGLILARITQPAIRYLFIFILILIVIMLAQLIISGRYLSIENMLGSLFGLILFWLLITYSHPDHLFRLSIAMILLVIIFSPQHYKPDLFHISTNWIPFKDQINTRFGFAEIATSLWPYSALGFLFLIHLETDRTKWMLRGAFFIIVFSLGIEWWHHTVLSANKADITHPILALTGWLFSWLYFHLRYRNQ